MSTTATLMPRMGTFAVLRIDPVASVAHLDDPEATAAASTLFNQDYVVYSLRPSGLPNPYTEFRDARPAFVMQGTPQDLPDKCIEAGMSIPIAPQTLTVDEHPSHREPLMPTPNPLPWPDCYITIFVSDNVRSPNVRKEETIVCELNQAERARYYHFAIADDEREAMLLDEKDRREREAQNRHDEPNVEGDSEENLNEPVDEDPDESIEEEELDNDESMALFRGLVSGGTPEYLIVAKFTYDLHRVVQLNDPRQYFDEVAQIEEIVKASQARQDVVKAAAARNDSAQYDDKTTELLQSHQALHGLHISDITPAADSEESRPLPMATATEKAPISIRRRISEGFFACAARTTGALRVIRRVLCLPVSSSSNNL
ncbi:hypothetical protein MIND_01358300 [Mycena indigotica]|uniref:Uncharacterized protein n=1 Tax=Mycena indigotica TaxID=2126181 RepID=A0A8H6VVJ3_9AGAR|nr:uncharacterized protein MIND_01358300 [Mycena indigotica]KAF7289839.1 hypothetical protein MIND_01358300 [Mycena indigotica]